MKQYKWFASLCYRWQERTGHDPVDIALHQAHASHRETQWEVLPVLSAAGICICALIFITLGVWWEIDSLMTILLKIAVPVVMVFLLAELASRCGRKYWGKKLKLCPRDEPSFDHCLRQFLGWAGRTEDDPVENSSLGPMAHDILLKQAREVVIHQRIPDEKQGDDWGKQLDCKKLEMRKRHQCLLALGIAREYYRYYYREAERQLDSEP